MRGRSWIPALALVALIAAPASAGKSDDLLKEVRAIGDRISELMIAGDFDAMLDLYLDDAISLPNFGPRMDGIETFREHHAEMESAGVKILSFESEPTDVWREGGLVVEIGTYELAMTMAGMPGPINDSGKYMTIYERRRGELKIKAEMWNTDVNPMTPGGGEAPDDHGHAGHDHAGHDHD